MKPTVSPTVEKKPRRRMFVAAIVAAGFVGTFGGAIGGAAGAMWVLETVGKPKIAAQAKNAVISYEDMPREGARPVDIAGISRTGIPLHPCVIGFLEDQESLIGKADWDKVRLHAYYKSSDDIINQLAFSRGSVAITRGNDIYVNVPEPAKIERLSEVLYFHELVHVAQYAQGMDLPEYASSAAYTYASGERPEDNDYEIQARNKSLELKDAWVQSEHRKKCHPDLGDDIYQRASSEVPKIRYAIFSSDKGEYELVHHEMHKNTLIAARPENEDDTQTASNDHASRKEPA